MSGDADRNRAVTGFRACATADSVGAISGGPVVTHVVSSLKLGGAERVMLDLALAQRRAGLSIRILSLGASGEFLVNEALEQGFEVTSVADVPSRAGRRRLIHRVVTAPDCRVVHVHSPWGLWALCPSLPFTSAKVIYTRHGALPMQEWRWRLMYLWAQRFVEIVTFVSPEGRAVSRWAWQGWKRPPLVIENGVNLEVDAEWMPSPDGRVRVGCVGRMVALKGQRFLLESLAALPSEVQSRVSLQFFGDGPDRADLEAYAAQRLAKIPVTFHGTVMDRDAIYREVDVLAVSSQTEAQSLAILEAMARWIPVVATDVGGNPTLVLPETSGLLVPYGDVPALSAALARFITDPGLRARMGEGARRLVEEQHSLEDTVEKYLRLYGFDRQGSTDYDRGAAMGMLHKE